MSILIEIMTNLKVTLLETSILFGITKTTIATAQAKLWHILIHFTLSLRVNIISWFQGTIETNKQKHQSNTTFLEVINKVFMENSL